MGDDEIYKIYTNFLKIENYDYQKVSHLQNVFKGLVRNKSYLKEEIFEWRKRFAYNIVSQVQGYCGKDIFKYYGYRWFESQEDYDENKEESISEKWFLDGSDGI